MIQINSRHKFLEGFLGTKPEEDISHAMANEVNMWFTVTTCICCVLEILLYFVYNRMVNKHKMLIQMLQALVFFFGNRCHSTTE